VEVKKMVELNDKQLVMVKGGAASWITSLISGAFDFVDSLFTGIETAIMGNGVLNSGADSASVDVKSGKITVDNTKSNEAEHELEMQKLKQFGAPVGQQLALM
jgi:hypothetical protein